MTTTTAEDFPATWEGGHALIIEFGDEEIRAHCQCGTKFGECRPNESLDTFGTPWEQHVLRLPR
jgi:hypothetical protein